MAQIKRITNRYIRRFLLLKEQQQLLILSFLVGIASGLAATLLKFTIHLVKDLLTSWFNASEGSLLYLAYPGIGILITVLYVRYFVKDNIGHGVTKILYAISRNRSKLKSHNCYTSIVASSFTIGFGGSVGAEAPIVLTGASIGSTIGQFFRLNYRSITLLLGCGAAGAVAGIFKAPLAGIVFTLEILMLDLTMSSIIPLLVSAVSASGISYFVGGSGFAFSASSIQAFSMGNIPYYIALGIFCGFTALYFTRATMAIEGRLAKVLNHFRKWAVGAVTLGILIFFIPPLYGEGYEVITALLNGRSEEVFVHSIFFGLKDSYLFITVYLVLILFFKVVAMAVTNGSGGVGGTFGPTLFMGGIAGFFVARTINQLGAFVPEANFTLVGMGGMMAAVMHAPLTAIFLIAEISGGYTLFMPLIITSITSFITIRAFEKHSIYTKRLALRGELITHNKDKAALTMLLVSDLIERDFIVVRAQDSLGQLVKAISKSKRNIFPVVNSEEGTLEGVVLLDDIRKIMFDHKSYSTVFVKDLMTPAPDQVSEDDTINTVLDRFEQTNTWNLPVVNQDNQYVGFLSKSRVLSAYRNVLLEFSDD